ncbi:hypothetical protein K9M74_02550 [Candidatus Woesearchaeota archaeon]|nr:hypothetical protein [Candidatus Woesearchaeota archaeon]
MKKIRYVIVLVIIFLTAMAVVLAEEETYPHSCCLTPFAAIPLNPDATADDCAGGQLWQEQCYSGVKTAPLFNDSLTQTRCCCNGIQAAFSKEAGDAEKNLSDVLVAYCKGRDYESKPLAPYASCSNACSSASSLTPAHVAGYVFENSSSDGLTDIKVTLQFEPTGTYETTTTNGYYNFTEDLPVGIADITLTTPSDHAFFDCDPSTTQDVFLRAGNQEYNFTLTCTQKEGACIPDWIIGEWSDCFLYAGNYFKTREIHDRNNCSLPLPNTTSQLCADQPNNYGVCNDGTLDMGEQCDITGDSSRFLLANGTTKIFSSSVSCQDVFGTDVYAQGTMGCTEFCTYDIADCNPACTGTCDSTLKCDCTNLCDQTEAGRAICDTTCDTTKPQFLSNQSDYSSDGNVYGLYSNLQKENLENAPLFPGVAYQLGSKDVTLTWDYEQGCETNIVGFIIQGCKKDGNQNKCSSQTLQEKIIFSPTQHTGTLNNFLIDDTSYCYNVCALTKGNERICAYDSNNLPCFSSGDKECRDPYRPLGANCKPFSDDSTNAVPVQCSKGGEYKTEQYGILTNLSLERVEECLSSEVCVETIDEPGAKCLPVTDCDRCNGLFGLYANFDLDITTDDERTISCSALQYYGAATRERDKVLGLSKDIGQCYKDRTLYTQPMYKQCESVVSCYDYDGEGACLNDPCMNFQGEGLGCEWTPYNEELGIGVCSPLEDEAVVCGLCDAESPLGFCTETMCEVTYGKLDENNNSLCYYNEEKNTLDSKLTNVLERKGTPLVPTCVHKNDVGCAFYDTKTDCIGETGQNASYNISYDVADDPSSDTTAAKPIAGTNTQLSASQDYFGFGTCVWDDTNNVCIKNTNNYFFHKSNKDKQEDCLEISNSNKNLQCLTDNEPPNTTILWKPGDKPTYGPLELVNLAVTVSDASFQPSKLTTLFAIYEDTFSYPNYTLQDLKSDDAAVLRNSITADANYTVAYFSFDPADNREFVQTKNIHVDMTAPQPTITTEFIYEELKPDVYVTTLNAGIEVSEQAHCAFSLYNDQNLYTRTQPANDKELFAMEKMVLTYNYLRDGQYYLHGYCEDEFGNVKEHTETIKVQGDQSVTDTEPMGNVFGVTEVDNILFSLTTANPANCNVSKKEFSSSISGDEMKRSDDSLTHSLRYAAVSDFSIDNGTHTYFVRCSFDAPLSKTVENDPADTISFTIDGVPPTSALLINRGNDNFETYRTTGEEWSTSKHFRINCSDDTGMPLGSAGCEEIHYCFSRILNTTATPETLSDFCSVKTFTGEYKDIIIDGSSDDLTTYGQKYIYFYAEDKKGNVESTIHREHLHIRNTVFDEPEILIV